MRGSLPPLTFYCSLFLSKLRKRGEGKQCIVLTAARNFVREEYVKEAMFYRSLYECPVCQGKFELEETMDQLDKTKLYFNWKESE